MVFKGIANNFFKGGKMFNKKKRIGANAQARKQARKQAIKDFFNHPIIVGIGVAITMALVYILFVVAIILDPSNPYN